LLYVCQVADEYVIPVEIHHVAAAELDSDGVFNKACVEVRQMSVNDSFLVFVCCINSTPVSIAVIPSLIKYSSCIYH